MARTYTIGEALGIVSGQTGRKLEEHYAAYLANQAVNVIWNKYDWRETLAPLPPFYLIANEQEFGAPAAIIPSDFLGLREAYLVSTAVSSPTEHTELKVQRDIRLTSGQALPSLICYQPSVQRYRVYPRVPAGIGGTDWIVEGTYKIRPTKITPSTLQTTTVPWDDQYFPVFISALKWAAFDTAGDPRAGQVVEENGRYRLSGQLATMCMAIDNMAADEGLNLGDPGIAPAEPLLSPVDYGNNFSGLGY